MVEYNQKIMGMRLQNWRRITAYVVAVIVLFVGGYLIQFVDWQGGVFLHTLMELTATLLAFFVGTLALIRYMSQSDPKFLYIGAGFMGTAFLDAYHTVVTSSYFQPLMPTEYAQLVPWSWSASRLFLSVLMVMSWVLWLKHRNQNDFKPNTKVVFLFTAIATYACFMLFAFVPLPAISIGHDWIHRPFELIPAMLFLVALVGYLFKGMWVEDDFEHWLILSLIVGFGLQLAFMPFSAHVNDTEFNVAHLFKKLSYIFVLTGLLKSLYQTYISLKKESEKRLALEEALRQEAEASAQNEQWFRSVADYTYDWETWISPSGELLYTSPSCERITGYSASAFMTGEVGIASIISPSEAVATVRHFQDMPSIDDEHESDFRILTKDGKERWISHVCRAVYDTNGKFLGRRGSNRDITDRKMSEIESHAMSMALHKSPVAVLITDAEGAIDYVNPKFTEVTGYAFNEVQGKNPRILQSGQHTREFYLSLWSTLTSGETWTGNILNKKRDGSLFWEYAAISPIIDESGVIKKYVAVKQDVTDKKAQEEAMYLRANFDGLTGLPNRTLFDDRFDVAFKKAKRSSNILALMMLDIDHFKEVNDTLGHDAGDELLKMAADRMSKAVRETDTIGRIGGDEFSILLENFEGKQTVSKISQRILEAMAKPFLIKNKPCHVSASIGVVFTSGKLIEKDMIKKSADIALYEAKAAGRNCVVFFKEA